MLKNREISDQDLQMVKKIAKFVVFKYLPHFETHVSERLLTREELYHQGVIGCIKAKRNYDPSKGGSFVKYAYMFIKGEMISLLRMKNALIHVPREKYQEMRCLHNEREKGKSDFEIAENLGWEMGKVVELETLKLKIVPINSDETRDDSIDGALVNGLEFKPKNAETLLEEKEILEIVSRCIENISRTDSRLILIARYRLEKTLAQLSVDFNCSIETIRNRQREAEMSVKKCLKRNGVE